MELKPFVAPGMTDQTIAQRIMELVDDRFPGTFSSRWIARAYCDVYGEITTRKITSILEDLADAGFLIKVDGRKKRNRPNQYRHRAPAGISRDMAPSHPSGQPEHI